VEIAFETTGQIVWNGVVRGRGRVFGNTGCPRSWTTGDSPPEAPLAIDVRVVVVRILQCFLNLLPEGRLDFDCPTFCAVAHQ